MIVSVEELLQGMVTGTTHESKIDLPWLKRCLVTKIHRDVRMCAEGVKVEWSIIAALDQMAAPDTPNAEVRGQKIMHRRIVDMEELDKAVDELCVIGNKLIDFGSTCSPLDELGIEIMQLSGEEKP